jgi:hypothetical protein
MLLRMDLMVIARVKGGIIIDNVVIHEKPFLTLVKPAC